MGLVNNKGLVFLVLVVVLAFFHGLIAEQACGVFWCCITVLGITPVLFWPFLSRMCQGGSVHLVIRLTAKDFWFQLYCIPWLCQDACEDSRSHLLRT